jgi:anthranilate/para-aminobenzoate synthase component II
VRVLILDNQDPFLDNLLDPLRELGAECDVKASNSLDIEDIRDLEPQPRRILITSGPGRPEDTGACLDVVEHLAGMTPILGIGLGLRVIAHVTHARLIPAKRSKAAGAEILKVRHDGKNLFAGLPNVFDAPRDPNPSPSLDPHRLGTQLEASAWDQHGGVIGCRAWSLGVEGIQLDTRWFSTRLGNDMLFNFLYQSQTL